MSRHFLNSEMLGISILLYFSLSTYASSKFVLSEDL